LERIYEYEDIFDAVVLIRGGGSSSDLMCFDTYWLAVNIAQFPLPVLTGIGHERDESVCDLVAHTKLKTPTAVAEFIIDRIDSFSAYLDDLQGQVVDESRQNLKTNAHRLELSINTLQPLVKNIINKNRRQPQEAAHRLNFAVKTYFDHQQSFISHVKESIHYLTKKQVNSGLQLCQFQQTQLKLEIAGYLKNKQQKLKLAEKTLMLSNPLNILKRGYSITYKEDQAIKDSKKLKVGESVTTHLHKGYLISRIEKIND
jgi:exodeoxyribonuclease VII large subunit